MLNTSNIKRQKNHHEKLVFVCEFGVEVYCCRQLFPGIIKRLFDNIRDAFVGYIT